MPRQVQKPPGRATDPLLRSPVRLSDKCVYTIVSPERLHEKDCGDEESQALSEGRTWVTARKLLQEATHASQAVPIIFADATHCSQLIAWGLLVSTNPGKSGAGTDYTFRSLRWISRSRQGLRVHSSGKPIKPGHIRPYVICQTPEFILTEDSSVKQESALLRYGDWQPTCDEDARERVERSIAVRRGQKEFREALLEAYGRRCAITGCDAVDALEAAHIEPFNGRDFEWDAARSRGHRAAPQSRKISYHW